MRKIPLFVLGLALMAPMARAEEAFPVDLKVMSFNLRYGTADDGEDAWPNRRGLVVETIERVKPDVFGTQECLEFQADYLAEHLPDYHWIGMGRDVGGGGEMAAIFYRKALLAPLEFRHFWLAEHPELPGPPSWDSSINRMATWVRFYHREAHRAFSLVNTHFDHKGVVAREKSAERLAALIKDLPADQPLILTGDYNSVAEISVPWQTLINAGMQDAWKLAEKTEGPQTTWSGFGNAVGREEPFRIDWILVRGPVEVAKAEVVTYSKDGHYPSDHFPAVAELRLWMEEKPPVPQPEPRSLERTR